MGPPRWDWGPYEGTPESPRHALQGRTSENAPSRSPEAGPQQTRNLLARWSHAAAPDRGDKACGPSAARALCFRSLNGEGQCPSPRGVPVSPRGAPSALFPPLLTAGAPPAQGGWRGAAAPAPLGEAGGRGGRARLEVFSVFL